MKKLLFLHHYNSSVGAGLSFLHILQSLSKEDLDITVCIPKIAGDLDAKIKAMGISVIYSQSVVPYMHFNGSDMRFLSRRNAKNMCAVRKAKTGVKELIESVNPDIVAVNSLTLFWVGRIAKECKKKSVCFHRETYDKGWFGYRTSKMKKELSQYFDRVVFLSNYDINETPKGCGDYVRITDKVDVVKYEKLNQADCRQQLDLPQNTKLILYAGGVAKLKGPHILLKALAKCKDEDCKLVFLQYQFQRKTGKQRLKYIIKALLGKNLEYRLLKIIDKHKLQEKIIFRPPTDKVEQYFVACDVVVFPSTKAHQARPAYEAGIAKKPIILTDFDNTREFVDERNGWLFKNKDFKDLAKCIKDALRGNPIKVQANYEKSLKDNNLSDLPRELSKLIKEL